MPPRPRPPRLWLRPARPGRGAAYFILDRGQQHATRTADPAEAEQALSRYLVSKHTAGISHGKRETNQIPILDVLTVYGRDIAPNHAQPDKTANRLMRLIDLFSGKTLAQIDGALCRAARRDLEELRAAINHHRKEGLHDRMVSVVLPPPRPPRERWLTWDEAAALLWETWCRGQSKHIARFIPASSVPPPVQHTDRNRRKYRSRQRRADLVPPRVCFFLKVRLI